MILAVIVILHSTIFQNNNLPFFTRLAKRMANTGTPDLIQSLIFVALGLIFWVSIFVFRYYFFIHDAEINRTFMEWIACTFTNYDDADPMGWKDVCGDTAAFRISFDYTSWIILANSGQGILISVVYGRQGMEILINFLTAKRPTSMKQKIYTEPGSKDQSVFVSNKNLQSVYVTNGNVSPDKDDNVDAA